VATSYTHRSRPDGQPADGALVQSYTAQRRRLITANLAGAAKVVLGITVVYALAELIQSPARFKPQLLPYLIQFLIPLVTLRSVRNASCRHPEIAALAADLVYTTTLASRLLLPTETTSGVALFLCLKMVGTAILFPWGARVQCVSAGVTILLYWGLLIASGRPIEPAAGPHQLLGPVVAAVLSVAGAMSTERVRRTLFRRGVRLARSEAHLRSLLESVPDGILVIEEGRIVFANPPLVEMLGYAGVDDLLGRRVQELAPPEGRDALYGRLDRAMFGKVPRLDTDFLGANGEPVFVGLTFARLRYRTRPAVQVMVRDITERKQAQDRMEVLLDVAKTVSGRLELWEILDRVQRRTVQVLHCDAVATLYWDAGGEFLRMIAGHGMPVDVLRHAETLEFHRGVPFVDRLTSMQTVVVNDAGEQPWVPAELLAGLGIGAVVVTQLHVRGRPIGALVAFNTTSGRRFDANQVKLFEGIARQVAVAIETTELYQAQQQEAEVSSALARVGRELIASLGRPVLLDCLCQVTTEVLRCDGSVTVLLQREDDAYVAVSAFGYSPEEWEWMRVLRMPRDVLSARLAPLERDDVVQLEASETSDVLRELAAQLGITAVLCIALRRGDELIGFQAACVRERRGRFSTVEERIGRGVAQMASLALEHARVVEELARASRLKSDFVATMSHELRTPLSIIMGYNDLLLEEEFGSLTAEQAETLRTMARRERALLDLITATLDVSRLETGRLPVERQDVDVATLLSELDAETCELQRKPGLRVQWEVAPGLPRLYTDPLKLKVVLKNLLLNAVKFTDEGHVTVDAHARGGGGLEISVSDSGIGMAPEALAIVFEAFRQADPSSTRRYGGVGLGLYIVRRLLELLEGTISVDSELGRGSTFRVWLPVSAHCETGTLELHGQAA
jgi:two-component system sensor histidine kinase BarA